MKKITYAIIAVLMLATTFLAIGCGNEEDQLKNAMQADYSNYTVELRMFGSPTISKVDGDKIYQSTGSGIMMSEYYYLREGDVVYRYSKSLFGDVWSRATTNYHPFGDDDIMPDIGEYKASDFKKNGDWYELTAAAREKFNLPEEIVLKIKVKNGRYDVIEFGYGSLAAVYTFYDYGTTVIDLPSID